MRVAALASTCLVCAIHGRRVHVVEEISPAEQQDLRRSAVLSTLGVAEPDHGPLGLLTSLFFAAHPTLSSRGSVVLRPFQTSMSIESSETDIPMSAEVESSEDDNMDSVDEPPALVKDVEAIMSDLGQEPLSFQSRQMFYLPNGQLPALSDRVGDANVDLVERTLKLNPDLTGDVASFFAVVKALLLYGAGALDEAHNLVLPLCWYDSTVYAGPPIRNSAANQEAAYVNALLHRQEGNFLGQWGDGQVGWENAIFWFKQAGDHSVYSGLPKGAHDFVHGRWKAPASKALNTHMAEHDDSWSAEAFVNLTREAVESDDQEALEFCGHMMNLEWRHLLEHCWAKVKPQL
mmetsp:Transcript_15986/g.25555  ORF Transcript_15986/g.25555 Transcript_15986/m.25555 type:complete len:347 (+) Transcript_15986:85-1125(+)